MHSDHYQALGVHPRASQAEVRAAYLRLMRAHHPDRSPGNLHSATMARRANAAWDVLGDTARRASYDRLRAHGRRAARTVRDRRPTPPRAYSPARVRYRRAFHLAALRLGLAVFALGCVLLSVAR
jgi:curved DNA-binding protein CbpA